jgi:hypothetical protein
MTIQSIQRLREAQPFEPFRILVGDGRYYDVRHPENFMTTGNGRIIAVAMSDHIVTLDLLLVTGIARPIPQKQNGSRRKAS